MPSLVGQWCHDGRDFPGFLYGFRSRRAHKRNMVEVDILYILVEQMYVISHENYTSDAEKNLCFFPDRHAGRQTILHT